MRPINKNIAMIMICIDITVSLRNSKGKAKLKFTMLSQTRCPSTSKLKYHIYHELFAIYLIVNDAMTLTVPAAMTLTVQAPITTYLNV